MRKLRALAGAAVALVLAQLAVRLLRFRWLATAVTGLGVPIVTTAGRTG